MKKIPLSGNALLTGPSADRELAWRPWRTYAALYLRMFAGEIRARRNASASSRNKILLAGKPADRPRTTVAERNIMRDKKG